MDKLLVIGERDLSPTLGRVPPKHRAFALSLLLAAASGCQPETAPDGPEVVLTKWISTMRQVHGDVEAGDRVVQLLWKPARDNLKERARRASALSGRELSPGEVVAPSWFALHLVPERSEVRIDGEWAEVTLISASGEKSHARCRREEDEWKVALELPPLAPIRQRMESEETF